MPRITVDGVDYAPVGAATPTVAVGITTHNRPDVLAETLAALRSCSPEIPVIVVDDGSIQPVTAGVPVIRHSTAQGIPAAKNRCIAELWKLGAQHLFLFDDDTRPASADWWQPYVDSPEPHLQHSWTHFANGKPVEKMTVLHADNRGTAYGWSMGCMLYATRDVIARIGGMREDFAPAMHEHIEWSRRIHNAGLTTWPFQDVPDSDQLIHAADRLQNVQSSIDIRDRRQQLQRNDDLLEQFAGDASFVSYGTENIVLTCLFTGQPDPQRKTKMKPEPALADPLLASCTNDAVVLCDFDTDRANFVKVQTSQSPYVQRWISYRQYLLDHSEIRYVWCVDATDVQQLHDPFPMMRPGILYCGWENQVVGCAWMRDHHSASRDWIEANADRTLLNAGVVGADRATMLTFIGRLLDTWSQNRSDAAGDMGYFNRAAYTMNPVTGPRITTLFKANQPTEWSLWRHK
jgi:hypothetical protein